MVLKDIYECIIQAMHQFLELFLPWAEWVTMGVGFGHESVIKHLKL